MDLPDDRIGISDILAWRDCPRRFSFSMRRWTEAGEPPEATNESNAYGTAIHMVFNLIETEGLTDDQAMQRAFDEMGGHLWPHDLIRMKKDVDTYHEREMPGLVLVGSEVNAQVPLLEYGGKTIYFRGQIDRLHYRREDSSRFVHRDFKSSRWPKTQAEVDEDLQMWSYNWLIHEFWPECDDLVQVYDQLLEGEHFTRKTAVARTQIKEWLVRQVTAILNDESWQPDDLLAPKFSQWCPYCPILSSCPIPAQLSPFAAARITALSEVEAGKPLDGSRIEEYVADLADAATARKALEKYESVVKDMLKELPPEEVERLGYKVTQRRNSTWDSEALEAIHTMLGDEFFMLASLPKTRVEEYLRGDPRLDTILSLARKQPGKPFVMKAGVPRKAKT